MVFAFPKSQLHHTRELGLCGALQKPPGKRAKRVWVRKEFIYGNHGIELRWDAVENLDHSMVEGKKKKSFLAL